MKTTIYNIGTLAGILPEGKVKLEGSVIKSQDLAMRRLLHAAVASSTAQTCFITPLKMTSTTRLWSE